MKSEVFDEVLDAWFVGQLNSIQSGMFGDSESEKATAFQEVNEHKIGYIKKFAEEIDGNNDS